MVPTGLSPLKLAWVSIFGSTLFPILFLSIRLHFLPLWLGSPQGRNHAQALIRSGILLGVFLVSAGMATVPLFIVKKGLARAKWSEAEVDRLRRVIQHPAMNAVVGLCALGIVVLFLTGPGGPSGVMLLFPEMTIVNWKNLVRVSGVEQRSVLGL